MFEDGESARGMVSTVVRIGTTVRRPTGPWTPTVHALLDHLTRNGFEGAPRALGVDEQGREVLTLLTGDTAFRPWPEVVRSVQGVKQLGVWLRDYHRAVADFEPPHDARWRDPHVRWEPGMIARHGDLGPWNSIWREDRLVGFIDWDLCRPGYALTDLAQLAWNSVPLSVRSAEHFGFAAEPDRRARLDALCAAYGAEPGAVVDATLALMTAERDEIQTYGSAGMAPWSTFLTEGHAELIEQSRQWLVQARGDLLVT